MSRLSNLLREAAESTASAGSHCTHFVSGVRVTDPACDWCSRVNVRERLLTEADRLDAGPDLTGEINTDYGLGVKTGWKEAVDGE